MTTIVRLALFFTIVFSAVAFVFACSAPAPSLDESNNTKDDAGKKKSDAKAIPNEPPDELPPPTPGPPKDGGPIGDGGTTTDAGSTSPPAALPFLTLDVRFPVDPDRYITQCTSDGKAQLVWTTTSQGPDEYSRFATASYKENPGVNYPCGTRANGEYPIVLSWLPPDGVPKGTWIARCIGNASAQVYRVLATHAGHPAATYQYPEAYAACP